jgi:hypothetical protein
MDMTLEIPVVFTAPSATGTGTRTYLAYVPTTFGVPHANEADTRFVTTIHKPSEKTITNYRVCEDRWFRRYRWETAGPDATGRLAQEINVANARKTATELAKRAGSTTPKDARELLGTLEKKYTTNAYQRYLERTRSISASKDIAQAIARSDDFVSAYEKATAEMRELAPRYLMIGTEVYEACDGLAIQVCANFKGDVTVSTVELYNGALWRKPLKDMTSAPRDADFFYFNLQDRDEALVVAQRLSADTGRPLVELTEDQPSFAVEPEELPVVDMRYAELVRSSKNACRAVGEAIVQKLEVDGNALFTDDPSIRYAFDDLARVLATVSPFSSSDDRLEGATSAFIDAVTLDATATEATYAGFAASWKLIEHLKTCIDLWDDRPMNVEMVRKATPSC